MELKAHLNFIRSLQDRDGFMKALSNVHERMNGTALQGVDLTQQESPSVAMGESNSQQNSKSNMALITQRV